MFGLHRVSFAVAALLCGTINVVAAPVPWMGSYAHVPPGWPHAPQHAHYPSHLPTQGGFVDNSHLAPYSHGPPQLHRPTVPMHPATGHHIWTGIVFPPELHGPHHHVIEHIHSGGHSEKGLAGEHLRAAGEHDLARQAHRNHEDYNRALSRLHSHDSLASAHYDNIANAHGMHAFSHEILADGHRRASIITKGANPKAFRHISNSANHAKDVYQSLNRVTEYDKLAFTSYGQGHHDAAKRYQQSANVFRQTASDATNLSTHAYHAAGL